MGNHIPEGGVLRIQKMAKSSILRTVALSICTSLIAALMVVGAQLLYSVMEEHQQRQETKEYIDLLEKRVFNEAEEDRAIQLSLEAREEINDFPVPTRDHIRLARFVVVLENLELHLAFRATALSREDRFALLETVTEARDVTSLFRNIRARGGDTGNETTKVATVFFSDLRNSVEWLGIQ